MCAMSQFNFGGFYNNINLAVGLSVYQTAKLNSLLSLGQPHNYNNNIMLRNKQNLMAEKKLIGLTNDVITHRNTTLTCL